MTVGVDWKNIIFAIENDKLNRGYFETGEYKKYASFSKGKEALQFILKESSLTSLDLLDVGCGTGWQAVYFQREKLPLNYWGLDLSKHMCEFAKKNYPEGIFITANIENFVLDKTFNVVMESAVIELVSDWKKCIAGMVRLSKEWLVFHRMFFTERNTFMEQGTTYLGLPDLKRHIGLLELDEELAQFNFHLVHKDIWNITPSYKMGTFIARRF